MKKNLSKNIVLLLLILMFAAPGVAAYWFYQHQTWLSAATINKGVLLKPARLLNDLDVKNNKWHILFWTPENCSQACFKQLDMLARVRLALGRKLYNVDQWLLTGSQTEFSGEDKALLQHLDFQTKYLVLDPKNKMILSEKPAIYLANPDNFLILIYKADANPDDIYKDLKILVTASENKSG